MYPDLTPAQTEVLRLIGSGTTRTQTAETLNITPETVKVHLRNIRRRYTDAGLPSPTLIDLHRRAVDEHLTT